MAYIDEHVRISISRFAQLLGIQLSSLDIFDPAKNSITRLDVALAVARDQHAAAILPDGGVLIVGGRGADGPLASTEIIDPAASSVKAGPQLATARAGHSATRLDDGRVIVAGGFEVMSYTTRLIPFTSFTIRFETTASRSYGRRTQSAVMPSLL